MSSRTAGLGWVALSYVVAVAAGVATWQAVDAAPVWQLLAADIAGTVVIFLFSLLSRNASFYDPYWSVIPPLLGVFWLLQPEAVGPPVARQALVMALVMLWAVRLTANWARGWTGLDHEDWRYGMLAERTGAAYPAVNFLGIHLFPTLQVFMGCLPLWPVLAGSTAPLGWLDGLALGVTLGAVLIEHVADEQLRAFRDTHPPREAMMEQGLWSWSRHPNYLGEIGFWWGLWLFALAADPGAWWTGIGAFAITAMFVGISIPMIEERMVARRPRYVELQQRVSFLLLRPPRAKRPRSEDGRATH